jgi:probable O-glycosylation ligase (exosortase A-associated)
METIKTASKTDPSALSRINSWKLATRVALDYPILGGGFGTFTGPVYDRYGLREGPIILGPHSIYFQILAEHGFPGLFLFLGTLGSCFWTCRKVRYRFKRKESARWPVVYADMITVSLLAYAASGTFLGLAYFDLFYQVVGTTAVLAWLARREAARDTGERPGQTEEASSSMEEAWASHPHYD